MSWKCGHCGKKNNDHMKWCDWCDQAERSCNTCGHTFEWIENELTGFMDTLECRGCGNTIET